MKKLLVAGPWIGELGWELFAWQGYLRNLKDDTNKIEIICRQGHEYLYKDFANYEYYDPESTETDMWSCKNAKPYDYSKIPKEAIIIKPSNFLHSTQKFIKYGIKKDNQKYDLIIHARNTNKYGTSIRDWPEKNWIDLISSFKNEKIASIGTKKQALHIANTEDLRDISLELLANILASSNLLLGPSSGPIHFGSLCGIKHIVWTRKNTGMIKNKHRYEVAWNPLKTPVTVINTGWQPTVDEVLQTIKL